MAELIKMTGWWVLY